MKILFAPAHYYFSDKYGSESYWAYQIVKKSADFGHEVIAIVGVNDCIVDLNGYLGRVKIITTFPGRRSENVFIEMVKRLLFVFQVYFYVKKYCKDNSIDIIHHAFPSSPDTFSIVALFNQHNPPFIMGPLQVPTMTGGYVSFVHSNRGVYNLFSWGSFSLYLIAKPLLRLLSKISLKKVDSAFANTAVAKRYYQQIVTKKISVIPIGIDIPKQQNKQKSHFIILSTGYLTERKGHKYLIEAFSKLYKNHPSVKLLIVGNGPELHNLQLLVRQLGVGKAVTFAGFVPHEKIGDYYRKATVYVLPSTEESYGNVLLEAMGYGLPIVASDVGSIRSIVGKAGIFVKAGNTESLYIGIQKIFSSKKLQKELSSNAKKRIIKYSWNAIIQEYNTLYKRTKAFNL